MYARKKEGPLTTDNWCPPYVVPGTTTSHLIIYYVVGRDVLSLSFLRFHLLDVPDV